MTDGRTRKTKKGAHEVVEDTFWQDSETGLSYKVIGFKVERKTNFARLYPVTAEGEEITDASPILHPVDEFEGRMTWMDVQVQPEPEPQAMFKVDSKAVIKAAKDVQKTDEEIAEELGTSPQMVHRIIETEGGVRLNEQRQAARRKQRAQFTAAIKARFSSVNLSAHDAEIARMEEVARTPLEYVVPERPSPGMRRPSVAQKTPWNKRTTPEAVLAAVKGNAKKGVEPRDFADVAQEFGIKAERVRQIVKKHAPEIAKERASASREAAVKRAAEERAKAQAPEPPAPVKKVAAPKAKPAAKKAEPAKAKPARKAPAKA